MNLVIVESPKKAELIQGFLKKHKLTDYRVMASAGHVRDLRQPSFSIDVADNFRPEYVITDDKKTLVKTSSTSPPMKTVRERPVLGISRKR